MKVRKKDDHNYVGVSNSFNPSGMGEILIYFEEGDADSDYISQYEVQLSDGNWKDMRQAFKDKDLISDNYNRCFAEPRNEEDRERGYYF